MNMNKKSIMGFFMNIILVSLCCFLLGFLRYRFEVFHSHSLASIFPIYGLVSAPIFYALRDYTMRVALAMFLLIIFLDEFLLFYPVPLYDFFYGCSMAFARAVALYIFLRKFYLKNSRSLIHPLTLGVLISVCTFIVQFLFALPSRDFSIVTSDYWEHSYHQLAPRFLAGIGLGAGIWIADHPKITKIFRQPATS